ncbi:hypothetical protein [Nocardia sp. XZ_19_385]|uniref:hypothetical protein n=1 Tax=Nocardia sp. XZ_19_385 TaxID=2769488 RepID=UPI001890781F|nr:hypothetical protein [Nocardia sp. XZ_19_385]
MSESREPETLELRDVHGINLKLAPRRMRGPLVPGRPPWQWPAWAARIPAILLIVGLLVTPFLWTVVTAAVSNPAMVLGCALIVAGVAGLGVVLRRQAPPPDAPEPAPRRTWRDGVFAAALLVVVVSGLLVTGWALRDIGLWSYLRTLIYGVGGVALVLFFGLVLALPTRRMRWLWLPLLMAFGVSTLVSGVAFRLLFQRLGSGIESLWGYQALFICMLGSAFLWTWLGFAVGVFRAGFRALEADPACAKFLEWPGWSEAFGSGKRLLRSMFPVLVVVVLVVAVAAARVFDIVLIGVPGSMQHQVDTATVQWWRLATEAEPGVAAAYSLPLVVLVGCVAWFLQMYIGEQHRSLTAVPEPGAEIVRDEPKWRSTIAIAAVSALALVPIIALVAASLGLPGEFSFAALDRAIRDGALWRSLATTAVVATTATIMVVALSVPIAHQLAAWEHTENVDTAGNQPRRRLHKLRLHAMRAAMVAVVVLAVLPVQSYLGPLDQFLEKYELSGTRVPLIVLHVAAGLPISILILRGALLAKKGSPQADTLRGLASPGRIRERVRRAAGPALVAVAVLEFVQVWNDFVVGLMISGAGASPWSLLLWGEARQFSENIGQLAAGALLSSVPPVALVLITWRRWLLPGLIGKVL